MQINPYPGLFVVFEGPDGSGQTTQAELLSCYLMSKGMSVVLTEEPTEDSKEGQRIRRILTKQEAPIKAFAFQLLFIEDRRQHLKNLIIPALQSGQTVVGDRYILSTPAYGGAAGRDMDWLLYLNHSFIFSNIVFILDVPVDVCLRRIRRRGEGFEYFERAQMLTQVAENYKILAARYPNVHLIDGDRSRQSIAEDVRKVVDRCVV